MSAFYEPNQKPHAFVFLENVNDASRNQKIDIETGIKTFAKFKKLVTREEMLELSAGQKEEPDQLVFHVPNFNVTEVPFQEFMTSRLALFEDEDRWMVVNIGSSPAESLEKDNYYTLYGRFEFIEQNAPVFFATVLSHSGDRDKNTVKQTLELLQSHRRTSAIV